MIASAQCSLLKFVYRCGGSHFFSVSQDSVSDVLELLKKQEDLEAMMEAQNERFVVLKERKMQVRDQLSCSMWQQPKLII